MIKLVGKDNIDSVLKGMVPKVFEHKVLQKVYIQSAQPLINTEKVLAPKREGDLRESIGVKRTPVKRAKIVGEIKVGPLYKKGGRTAHLMEYGTKQRKLKGKGQYRAGTNRGAVRARPFVQPAWDKTKGQILGTIKQNVRDAFKKYVSSSIRNRY